MLISSFEGCSAESTLTALMGTACYNEEDVYETGMQLHPARYNILTCKHHVLQLPGGVVTDDQEPDVHQRLLERPAQLQLAR